MITLILDWFLNMTIYITSHSTLTKTAPHKTPLLRKDTIIGLSKSPTNGVLRLKIGGLNPKKVPNTNCRRVGSYAQPSFMEKICVRKEDECIFLKK